MGDINSILQNDKSNNVKSSGDLSNATKIIKANIISIVHSKNLQAEEADAQKEILKDLKENFGLEPKHVRKVVKLLMKPEDREAMEEDEAKVWEIFEKVK